MLLKRLDSQDSTGPRAHGKAWPFVTSSRRGQQWFYFHPSELGARGLTETEAESGSASNPSWRFLPAGSPDSRYIRVETCMFMIKLPQYSSLDVMLEKLRYAIHYREDPLSG